MSSITKRDEVIAKKQIAIGTTPNKKDFDPFLIGTIFNPLVIKSGLVMAPKNTIVLDYPSRLEAMAIDPSKIVSNNNLKYTPGQIDFTVKLFKRVTVTQNGAPGSILITEKSKRKSLIKHAVCLIRYALNVNDGLEIDVDDSINLRHCGLGSSSGLIAAVACALNELYGKPISDRQMVKYLAQNHGEEIDGNDEYINPVQCIGGSVSCGTHNGGVIILAGENTVVKTSEVDEDYDVIIGVPHDFVYPDSKYLMDKEIENLPKFLECGRKYGKEIAYKLFHECLPALEDNNLKPLGDLIFEYRWNMGSIENCSFVYPPILEISKKLAFLKTEGFADILALSSVGPGMFAITKHTDICEKTFKDVGMNIIKTKIHNGRYNIRSIN